MNRIAPITGVAAALGLLSACTSTELPLGDLATSQDGAPSTSTGGTSYVGSGGQLPTTRDGSASVASGGSSSAGGSAGAGSNAGGSAGVTSTGSDASTESSAEASTPCGTGNQPDAACTMPLWVRQFGGPNDDGVRDITVDHDGYIYTVGSIGGSDPGGPAIAGGSTDAFIRKFDSTRAVQWTVQFGSADSDSAESVSTDASGNVYVAGSAGAALPGQTALGASDVFVSKYDASGNELWTRQFGSSGYDSGSVAVDAAGNAYVSGFAQFGLSETDAGFPDAAAGVHLFVRKYDSLGTEVWTRQFEGEAQQMAGAATVDDAGNVYFAGYIDGALPAQTPAGGEDAFLRKYDTNGYVQWTRQFGTSANDSCNAVRADANGNIMVAGRTFGAFPNQTSSGEADAFVRKYDAGGNELWTRQFGTSTPDIATTIAIAGTGPVYIGGQTSGTLAGQTSAGSTDIFIRKYDPNGTALETRQFGTAGVEQGIRVGITASALYVGGQTNGVFAFNYGSFDGFLAQLAP